MLHRAFRSLTLTPSTKSLNYVNRRAYVAGLKKKKLVPKKKKSGTLDLEFASLSSEELVERGIHYASIEKYKTSAKYFTEALNKDENNPRIMSLLGELYDRGPNDLEQASVWLKRAIVSGSEDPDTYIRLGHIYLRPEFQDYDLENARNCYEQALKISKDKDLFFEIGFVSYELGDYNRAIESLELARTKDSSADRRFNAMILLADIYMSLNHVDPTYLDKSLEFYKLASKEDPSIEILLGLAQCHLLREEFTEAEKLLTKLQKEQPHDVDILVSLVELYLKTQRKEEALELATEILNMNSKHIITNYMYGKLCYDKTLYTKAIEHLQFSIEKSKAKDEISGVLHFGEPLSDSKIHEAQHILGTCYFQTGNLEMAKKLLEETIQTDDTNPHTHLMLGEIAENYNDVKAAAQHYKIASVLDPLLLKASFYAGVALAQLDQYEQSIMYFEKVLTNYDKAKQMQVDLHSKNEKEMLGRVYNNISAAYQRLAAVDKAKAAEYMQSAKRYFELSKNLNVHDKN